MKCKLLEFGLYLEQAKWGLLSVSLVNSIMEVVNLGVPMKIKYQGEIERDE